MKQEDHVTNTDLILKDLRWLEERKTSADIVSISQVLNHLAILSVTLGQDVGNAYSLMNELEDTYKQKYADFVKNFDGSVAKAELSAESELKEDKKNWTSAKNGYKKLSTFLDRVDKVLEAFRQSVSVIKNIDLKHG
jgi:hypothetical protein